LVKPETLKLAVLGTVGIGIAIGAAVYTSRDTLPPPVALSAEPPPPMAPPAAPEASATELSGSVLETIDVSRYTYLRIKTEGGEIWAAVPRAKVAQGDAVRVVNAMLMTGFHSQSLDRTFPEIYFGRLAGDGPAAAPHGLGSAAGQLPPGHPALSAAAPHGAAPGSTAPIGSVTPATGENGRTVAQVHAEAAALAGKKVRVRGVVVKRTDGILDRSWLHLQDGTGQAADGSNELVATTQATPELRSTVLLEGVVAVDKDFGSGYRYQVLLEDAKVVDPL